MKIHFVTLIMLISQTAGTDGQEETGVVEL